jgi:uncharacterized protein YkwD
MASPRPLCLALCLLACDAAAPAPEPAPEILDHALCEDVVDWDDELVAAEEDLLAAVNAARAAGGRCGGLRFPPAPPIGFDPALRCAARLHSLDMIARAYLGQVDPDGVGTGPRLAALGFAAATFAENVGFGYLDGEAAVLAWRDSPPNCWKLHARELTLAGAGVAAGEFTPKDEDPIPGLYWTLTLAAR